MEILSEDSIMDFQLMPYKKAKGITENRANTSAASHVAVITNNMSSESRVFEFCEPSYYFSVKEVSQLEFNHQSTH
ncbi:hypothetical protein HNY73_023008 [Argiope bruennichi]|uniref:Uncharacterized protein n=1 Tax=Argiope bruennichi TaxID=94029 RepID=A0A8T0E3V0_ARGBR|nr:hypothetical protein HNY73_023008 [Argiope bruennichi]